MKKIIFLFIFLFPILVCAAPVSYTVEGISVSESADNATDARKEANKKAQREGLLILFNRLGIDRNYIDIISDSEVEQMVNTMKVSNEKIGRKTYSATIDIVFSRDFVSFIFKKYNISKNSGPKNKYIIIPAVIEGIKVHLGTSGNIIYEQLENQIMSRDMNYLILPIKNELRALDYDVDYLSSSIYSDYIDLINKYEVDGALVILASYDKNEDKVSLDMKKLLKNNESDVKLNFFNTEKYNKEQLFDEAIKRTVDYIFKAESVNLKTEHNGLELYVPISNLKDFYDVEEQLKRSEFITSIRIKSLTRKLVVFHIDYSIEDELVLGELERNNFYIKENNGKLYLLTKTNFRLFQ